jgi:hypothetical protein
MPCFVPQKKPGSNNVPGRAGGQVAVCVAFRSLETLKRFKTGKRDRLSRSEHCMKRGPPVAHGDRREISRLRTMSQCGRGANGVIIGKAVP